MYNSTGSRHVNDSDTVEKNFHSTLDVFRELVFQGGDNVSKSLIQGGMIYWRFRNSDITYQKYARFYWKAALMYDNNPWGWMQLAEFNRVTKAQNFYESMCFFKSAYWNTEDHDLRANEIVARAYRLGVRDQFFFEKIKADGLERFWGIVSSFWIFQYQAYAAPTKDHQEGMGDFGKVAAVWCQLHRHFGLSAYPLYLVYVENDFNREIIAVIKRVLESLGFRTELVVWSEVGKYSFPKNSVIAILDDVSLLVKPDDMNQKSYDNIEQHEGNKFLVPWQVPDDFFSLERCPEHWKCCERLKGSLRDDPVSLIFWELPHYLYTGSCEFSEHLHYLEGRIANAVQVLYQDNLDAQMRSIAKLWPQPETSNILYIHMKYASHHPKHDQKLFQASSWKAILNTLEESRFRLSVSIIRRPAGGARKEVSADYDLLCELRYIQYFCENNGALLVELPSRDALGHFQNIFSCKGFYDHDRQEHKWITLDDDGQFAQPITISVNRKPVPLFSMVHFFRAWPPVLQELYYYLMKDFLPNAYAGGLCFQDAENKFKRNDYKNAIAAYHRTILHGNKPDLSASVIAAGMSYLYKKDQNYMRNAQAYFKAAIMYNNDYQGWLGLAEMGRMDDYVMPYLSRCYLGWAAKMANSDVVMNDILPLAHRLDPNFSPQKIQVDSLDKVSAILSPFWVIQYNNYNAYHTKDNFHKISVLWYELHSHLCFRIHLRPLCLVYVDNNFNRDILPVIEWVLESCGYCGPTLVLWSEVAEYSFPLDAFIMILDDLSLLTPPDENNKKCYEKIQNHPGGKCLVPWQVPDDLFGQDDKCLVAHWRFCKRLESSFRDDPMAVIFSELPRYLYEKTGRRPFEHFNYLERRMIHLVQAMYQEQVVEQMHRITALWSEPSITVVYASDNPEQDASLVWGAGSNGRVKLTVVPRERTNGDKKIFLSPGILHELYCIHYFCKKNASSLVVLPQEGESIFLSNGFYNLDNEACAWPDTLSDFFLEETHIQHLKILVGGVLVELSPMVRFFRAWPQALQEFYNKFNQHFLHPTLKSEHLKNQMPVFHSVHQLTQSQNVPENHLSKSELVFPRNHKLDMSIAASFILSSAMGCASLLIVGAYCGSVAWGSLFVLMCVGSVTLALVIVTGVLYGAAKAVRGESSYGFFDTVGLGVAHMTLGVRSGA